MEGGELLALWQKYGALPQPLVKIYIAELALVLGKLFININPPTSLQKLQNLPRPQISCIMLE